MERLTRNCFDDMQGIERYTAESPNIEINCGGDDYQEIIDKLAEYETAEEDGLLVRLPCKVGGTVFVDLNTLPFTDMEYSEEEQTEIPKFLPARVVSYRKNARTIFVKLAVRANWLEKWIDQETGPESAYYEKERYFSFPISAMGKTVFLTEEAAQEWLS